tara:strand:+ start:3194 stop:3412 length:219 start_codon:yes stop_codon:yes gene_type:complete
MSDGIGDIKEVNNNEEDIDMELYKDVSDAILATIVLEGSHGGLDFDDPTTMRTISMALSHLSKSVLDLGNTL